MPANSTGSTEKYDDGASASTRPGGSPEPWGWNVAAPSFENTTPFDVPITSAGPGHSSRCTAAPRCPARRKVAPASGEPTRPSVVPAKSVGSADGYRELRTLSTVVPARTRFQVSPKSSETKRPPTPPA